MTTIFDHFRNRFPVSDEKWAAYIDYFHRLEAPVKTTLLKEGEIPGKIFLIEKGCLRVWFNHDGKEVSFQFFFENSMVSSIESFRKGSPSPVSIETLEPSVLWYIHKQDVQRILGEISELPGLREQLLDAVFARSFEYMQQYLSSIRDSPQQRYLDLIRRKPQIIQRVPQHYIASYLGISTVHLSRIRSRLLREGRLT